MNRIKQGAIPEIPRKTIFLEKYGSAMKFEQVRKELNYAAPTLYKKKDAGIIPYYKMGRRVMFDTKVIIEFLFRLQNNMELNNIIEESVKIPDYRPEPTKQSKKQRLLVA